MSETLYDNFANIAALDKEKGAILNIFSQIKTELLELSKLGFKIDTSKTVKDASNASKELDKLQKQTIATQQKMDVQIERSRRLSAAAAIEGIRSESAKAQGIKATQQLIDARFSSEAKLVTTQSDYHKATVRNKVEQEKFNKELKQSTVLEEANSGSIEKARARVAALTTQRNKLNLFTKEGQDQLKKLNTEIDKNNQFVAKNADAALKQKLNIGNYSGAVKVLEQSLVEVRDKMEAYTKSGKNDLAVLQALTREEELLNQIVNSQASGFANATAEIRANQSALLQLEQAGLNGSKAFIELSQKTGDLKDAVGDLRERTKNLGSDTFAIDAAIQGAETLAGAYGIAQGATALFGVESEDLQKTLVKLQAVQTILTGLQSVRNALQTQSAFLLGLEALKTKALTVATRIQTFALSGATAAARTFNTALLATGIGALLLLIPLAVQGFDALSDSIDKDTKSAKELKEELEALNSKLLEAADNSDRLKNARKGGLNDLRRELEILEANGESEKRISEQRKKILNEELDNLRRRRSTIEEDGKIEIDLDQDILNKKNDILLNGLNLEKFYAEESKKLSEENSEKAKESAEKRSERDKRERAAQFELAKISQQRLIDAERTTATNVSLPIAVRSNARLKQHDLEVKLIQAQGKFELEQANLTSNEIILINTRTSDKIGALEVEAAANVIGIRKEAAETEKQLLEETYAFVRSEQDKQTARETEDAGRGLNNRIRIIQDQTDAQSEVLLDSYKRGKITLQQYEEQLLKITRDADRKTIEAEIDHQANLLNIQDLSVDERLAAEKRLYDLRRELRQKDRDESIKAEAANDTSKKSKADALKALVSEGTDTFFSLLQASRDREKNDLQNSIDLLEKKKEKDIEIANSSIQNAQDRAAAISNIESVAAIRRAALERKQRALDLEKARFDKAKAVADIIQGTGIAVVNALGAKPFTPANIGLAAIVGGLGALQLIKTLSAPLPRFFKGTDNAPEGAAHVAEQGRELAIEPKGRVMLYNRPTIASLIKGTRILPNRVTEDILASTRGSVLHHAASNISPASIDLTSVVDRLGDVVYGLGKIERKSGIIIQNNVAVESTAWYIKHFKT